jgi:hypothetical protein
MALSLQQLIPKYPCRKKKYTYRYTHTLNTILQLGHGYVTSLYLSVHKNWTSLTYAVIVLEWNRGLPVLRIITTSNKVSGTTSFEAFFLAVFCGKRHAEFRLADNRRQDKGKSLSGSAPRFCTSLRFGKKLNFWFVVKTWRGVIAIIEVVRELQTDTGTLLRSSYRPRGYELIALFC